MMKISKILAGCAALAMAASTVMAVSAADTGLWIKDWKVKEQQNVITFDNMDTAGAWNGAWVQFYSTNQSLDDVTLTFKVDTTNATWQTDDDGNKMNETGTYTVIRIDNGDETDKTTQVMYENNENVGGYDCVNDNGVYTITVKGTQIKAAIDAGNGQENEEEVTLADESTAKVYNVGFNIQFGHFEKGTWSVSASGASVVPFTGVDDKGVGILDTSALGGSDSKNDSKADSNADSKNDSKKDDSKATSSAATSTAATSSKAGTTGTTATSSAAASDNTAATGATAGLALAGVALAGAAIVISKRK